jgi:hypothetical protein
MNNALAIDTELFQYKLCDDWGIKGNLNPNPSILAVTAGVPIR